MSSRRIWSLGVRAAGVLLALAGPSWSIAAPPLVAPTGPLSPQEQQKQFHLPPGFEIQLFASEPAIHKPMNITFDSAGRLFVTDTLEYPYPAAKGATPRDTVKILEDRNLDGTADRITTFVDQLNIPLGVMPVPDGVVVYSIPGVWHCADTDGDGHADTRHQLFANFGHRDTHGMINSFTHGLDGWLYACHGFANDSAPQGTDGHQVRMNSGNTFRMRFDGSRVEQITHGQVNPFGMTVDPLGNFYTADCHSMPLYMLLRGAYYPSFGKAHDGLGFGPKMIKHDHGSTGIGGVAYYAASQFPAEYRDTIFIGNPVTGRVNHDRLESHGSTYEAIELTDFVSCDDPWFRPVNLQVGPDGALYIADFYNKIIGHYEVPLEHPGRDRHRGRIWRVVYTGAGVDTPAKVAPPMAPVVAQASLIRLLELLGDDNLTQRTLATHELVQRIGSEAVEPLRSLLASPEAKVWQRVHGMWALERLEGLSPELIERLANDADRAVRVHLMKLLAERSWQTEPIVLRGLSDPDPFVRRAAADALARHASSEHVAALLELWRTTPAEDTHLTHVARMALRDQLLAPGVYARLPELVGDDPDSLARLTEVSLGAPTSDAAAFEFSRLKSEEPPQDLEAHFRHAVRYLAEAQLNELYDYALSLRTAPESQQIAAVRGIGRGAQERGQEPPERVINWATQLARQLLAAQKSAQVRQGIDLASDFRLPLFDALAQAAGREARFDGLRTAAMDACAVNDPARAVELVGAYLGDPSEPLAVRQHAAGVMAQINDDRSRAALLTSLETAGRRLSIRIASELSKSPPGGEGLLAAVELGKASAQLLHETPVVARLRTHNLPNFEQRLKKLTAGLPAPDQRIRELIQQRRGEYARSNPDLEKGAAVFKKHCSACHRIGDLGEKVGPNLDGVGIRGLDRLLEDVLDPSRNVDQAFRTALVVTSDGRILTGLPLREEGQVVVLADAQGKEMRVSKQDIDERTESQLSIMPTNVPELINETDFVHLIGYLLAQRATNEPPEEAR